MREFGGYMIAPGNGLPALDVNALDPLDYLASEIAARDTTTDQGPSTLDKIKDELGKDRAPAVASALGVPSIEEIKKAFKGGMVAVSGLAVGLVLIIFGFYYLSKD